MNIAQILPALTGPPGDSSSQTTTGTPVSILTTKLTTGRPILTDLDVGAESAYTRLPRRFSTQSLDSDP